MRQLLRFILLLIVTRCWIVKGFSVSHTGAPARRTIAFRVSSSDYEEVQTRRPGRRIRPNRSRANTQAIQRKEAQARHAEALKDPTLLTNVQFSERSDLHPSTKRALTETMGLQAMTEIQAKTYAAAWSGKSVLGRARTGTGKTLAFLLPVLERLLQADRSLYIPGRTIGALIVAPTRELAIQIADTAQTLLTYHAKDYTVWCQYGGTKMQRDSIQFQKRLPTILVTTPGRLLDHISDTRVRGRKFSDILRDTKIVVLDEFDRLLDMGFQRDLKKILSYMPRPGKRQTLLFSATVPKKVRPEVQDVLGKDHVEVDCVKDNTSLTNVRVTQNYLVLESMDEYVVKLVDIVMRAMEEDDEYKILVFFPATKLVRFFATLFADLKIPTLELHSRMSQSARQKASSEFRRSKRCILFTSDVSARGVDYPDVTTVIQYGSADSKVTYTHRLGRTGRAGKSGQGLLVLLPFEAPSLVESLRRSGVQEYNHSTLPISEMAKEKVLAVRHRIASGEPRLKSSAEGAYRAFLAYYMSRIQSSSGWTVQEVVESANRFASNIGLSNTPSFPEKIARKLNLIGVSGVNVEEEST